MNSRRSLFPRVTTFQKLLLGLGILLSLAPLSLSYSKQKTTTDDSIQVADEATPTPLAPTPTPTSSFKPKNFPSDTNAKTLVLHKPATNPAWGRVVEYRKEVATNSVDKTPETLHIFLFQDDQGVVRTAVYHESSSGDGYWEVLVWDR